MTSVDVTYQDVDFTVEGDFYDDAGFVEEAIYHKGEDIHSLLSNETVGKIMEEATQKALIIAEERRATNEIW